MSISRRKLLKGLGLAGLSATLFPALNKFPGLDSGASAISETNQGKTKLPKQWVRVIDLKKCDGCEGTGKTPQCKAADRILYHTREGEEWIDVKKVKGEGNSTYWMPIPCMHCENAACVNVCPVGATYHNENGTVLVDNRRCIGCRMCMAACPYDRRFFYWDDRKEFPQDVFTQYSPEFPLPPIKGTVNKCVLCEILTKDGRLPACIGACPRGAMYFGDLESDIATNGKEVVALKKMLAENNAFRYKESLGTKPRVYYLPGHGQEQGREPRE
jgi:molybdopterin-containing oxidoreductase family iron-sulfur binding subunit